MAFSASHIPLNLRAWTFPVQAKSHRPSIVFYQPSAAHSFANRFYRYNNTSILPVFPITSGSSIDYCNPSTPTALFMSFLPAPVQSVSSSYPNNFHLPTVSTVLPQQPRASVFLNDILQLVASIKKYHILEWKLAQSNGNRREWHGWVGQFNTAVESAALTDDDKLTYLKGLIPGKAKTAIPQFEYCGRFYRDALKTLELNFGQAQAIFRASWTNWTDFHHW